MITVCVVFRFFLFTLGLLLVTLIFNAIGILLCSSRCYYHYDHDDGDKYYDHDDGVYNDKKQL